MKKLGLAVLSVLTVTALTLGLIYIKAQSEPAKAEHKIENFTLANAKKFYSKYSEAEIEERFQDYEDDIRIIIDSHGGINGNADDNEGSAGTILDLEGNVIEEYNLGDHNQSATIGEIKAFLAEQR